MEPLYENTPFERIALWSPLIGICCVVVALVVFVRVAAAPAPQPADPPDQPTFAGAWTVFALRLGAVGVALIYLGLIFVLQWREAHAAYPTRFGIALLAAASCVIVMGPFAYRMRGAAWMAGLVFWSAVISVALVAGVAAFSHSIIAEGQVTAMVLPLALCIGAAVALAVGALAAVVIPQMDPWSMMNSIGLFAFLLLAYAASRLLPVVQFRADGSVFPVTGAFWIVAAGVIAANMLRTAIAAWIGAAIACGVGYWLASWYGVTLALLGISVGWILRSGLTSPPAPHRTA